MLLTNLGFPYSSVGKESTRSVRDPSSIPGLGYLWLETMLVRFFIEKVIFFFEK